MSTPVPTTADLAAALSGAANLLNQKAINEAQIVTLTAANAQLDVEILAQSDNIAAVSAALGAYATALAAPAA